MVRRSIIQRYVIAAYPEAAAELARLVHIPPGALSIDYLLGEPAARGHGMGPAVIGAFIEQIWAEVPSTHDVVVPVVTGNRASWRSLELCGFTRVAQGPLVPDNPIDPLDHVIYQLRRRPDSAHRALANDTS